jgi:hypothetical protein
MKVGSSRMTPRVVSPSGTGTKNGCAGGGQQKFAQATDISDWGYIFLTN